MQHIDDATREIESFISGLNRRGYSMSVICISSLDKSHTVINNFTDIASNEEMNGMVILAGKNVGELQAFVGRTGKKDGDDRPVLEEGKIHVAIGANLGVFREWERRQQIVGPRRPKWFRDYRDLIGIDPRHVVFHLLDGYETNRSYLDSNFRDKYLEYLENGAELRYDPMGKARTEARHHRRE